MKIELLKILKSEVKPALGCTGPISVALAAAAAKNAVGGELKKLELTIDKDTYKNSISVATPNTPYYGVIEPAVVAAMYGNASYGLEVLRDIGDNWDSEKVKSFALENTDVSIKWDLKVMGVYIEAYAYTDRGIGHAIVAQQHDKIVFQEANGITQKKDLNYSADDLRFDQNYPIRAYKIKDFYDFICEVPIEDITFLKKALEINYNLAKAGLDEGMGARFGEGFSSMGIDTYVNRAKALASAASDARMSGKALSAMSCASSGNVGITASVPLIPVSEHFHASEEILLRAVALSFLLTIYGKAHIGRLSPMCACAMVASIGIGAGSCYMMGGDYEQIEATISNIVGATGGVLCDGAKFGCALKLAFGVGNAIESAALAMIGKRIPLYNGVVGANADETLTILGRIASKGMQEADEIMCNEFIKRETRVRINEKNDTDAT